MVDAVGRRRGARVDFRSRIMTATTLAQGGQGDALRDRVAIVTGAGQGIGRTFVKALAAAGAIPVIAERNAHNAQRVAQEIASAAGRSLSVVTDVSDPGSVEKLIGAVSDKFGRIDILVNNAAIF